MTKVVPTIHRLEDLTDQHALLGIIGGVSGPRCEPRDGGAAIHCGRCLHEARACQNIRGLSALGRWLIPRLMERGMLIDVAHMSEKGIGEVGEIVRNHEPDPYPIYVSHGNPRLALDEEASTLPGQAREPGGG